MPPIGAQHVGHESVCTRHDLPYLCKRPHENARVIVFAFGEKTLLSFRVKIEKELDKCSGVAGPNSDDEDL